MPGAAVFTEADEVDKGMGQRNEKIDESTVFILASTRHSPLRTGAKEHADVDGWDETAPAWGSDKIDSPTNGTDRDGHSLAAPLSAPIPGYKPVHAVQRHLLLLTDGRMGCRHRQGRY